MISRAPILNFLLIAIFFVSCDNFQSLFKQKRVMADDDSLLAQVEDREMYLSDIGDMIIANTEADSLNQLNTYVESWIKRNVVLSEAENNFPDNIDIDKLVEDYRSSLLLHNYRQVLIEKELNTEVTKEQEAEYYKENREQYRLKSRLCRGRIAIIPETAPRMERFYRNWKRNDTTAISKYLLEHATNNMNEEDIWYTEEEFLSFLPAKAFKSSSFKKPSDLQKNYKDFEYFVKINEVLDQNEIAPLSYVKESIRKVIIHHRKKQILDNIEQNLYQKYLQANRIKVFTKE